MSHAFDEDQKRYAEFKLLTRIGATFDGVAWMFHRLLTFFGWNKVMLIYTDEGHPEIAPQNFQILELNSLVHHFKAARITMETIKHEPDEPNAKEEIIEILEKEVDRAYASKIFVYNQLNFDYDRDTLTGLFLGIRVWGRGGVVKCLGV